MTDVTHGELLEQTERFHKSKRNTLFWAATLIAVEITHTGRFIKSPFLGDSILISPTLLGIGLAILMAYHFTGFLLDRRFVIWYNNDIGEGHRNISLPERLDAESQIIKQLANGVIGGSEAADQALEQLIEQAKRVQEYGISLKASWDSGKQTVLSEAYRYAQGVASDNRDPELSWPL